MIIEIQCHLNYFVVPNDCDGPNCQQEEPIVGDYHRKYNEQQKKGKREKERERRDNKKFQKRGIFHSKN